MESSGEIVPKCILRQPAQKKQLPIYQSLSVVRFTRSLLSLSVIVPVDTCSLVTCRLVILSLVISSSYHSHTSHVTLITYQYAHYLQFILFGLVEVVYKHYHWEISLTDILIPLSQRSTLIVKRTLSFTLVYP